MSVEQLLSVTRQAITQHEEAGKGAVHLWQAGQTRLVDGIGRRTAALIGGSRPLPPGAQEVRQAAAAAQGRVHQLLERGVDLQARLLEQGLERVTDTLMGGVDRIEQRVTCPVGQRASSLTNTASSWMLPGMRLGLSASQATTRRLRDLADRWVDQPAPTAEATATDTAAPATATA